MPTVTREPLRRNAVLRLIVEQRAELAARGVTSLILFGSVARDEAGPESDVDLIVEFDRPVGFFALAELQERLEQVLGRAVDVFTVGMLKPRIYDNALKDFVRVK